MTDNLDMESKTMKNLSNPTSNQNAIPKFYVDSENSKSLLMEQSNESNDGQFRYGKSKN